MRNKKGFTLVELLVVVAIIALLLSILLPALGRAKQTAVQVKCGAHLKQLATVSVMLANENEGYFRIAHRAATKDNAYGKGYGKGSQLSKTVDHVSWINNIFFEDMEHAGVDLNSFGCPNLQRVRDIPDGTDYVRQYGSRWRIGYYLMAGRSDNFAKSKQGNNIWIPPVKTSDAVDLVMGTDVLEMNTQSPSPGFSTYPHSANGKYVGDFGNTPEDAKSLGSNTAKMDTSVTFMSHGEGLDSFSAASLGDVVGYWWNSPVYNNYKEATGGGGR